MRWAQITHRITVRILIVCASSEAYWPHQDPEQRFHTPDPSSPSCLHRPVDENKQTEILHRGNCLVSSNLQIKDWIWLFNSNIVFIPDSHDIDRLHLLCKNNRSLVSCSENSSSLIFKCVLTSMFLPSFFSVYIIAVVAGGTSIYCFLGIHRFHYSPTTSTTKLLFKNQYLARRWMLQ